MQDTLSNLVMALVAIVALIAMIGAGVYGSSKSELNECQKWQQQASAYDGFFLTQWQKDQCDAYKITINAPVK